MLLGTFELGTAVDVLEFLSRSEWPLVVAGTLWIVRRPLRAALERITLTKGAASY
jgi:hypothetical protein